MRENFIAGLQCSQHQCRNRSHARCMQDTFYFECVSISILESKCFKGSNLICGFRCRWVSPAGVNVSLFFTAEPTHSLFSGIVYIRARSVNGNLVCIHGVLPVTTMHSQRTEPGDGEIFLHNKCVYKQ